MGIFTLLPFFCLCITALATKINEQNGGIGDIANTTKTPPPPPPPPEAATAAEGSKAAQFKPGIAITVGIFTTIFSITFLLLLYVKHCRRDSYPDSSGNNHHPQRKNSGIDRKVVESLPIFRFSSLRGQKDGLECAVCLNRFEPDEVLRLLPKCKHAFHVECVDVWLEAHSTCPLCRYRVDPEDVLLVDGKSLYNHSDQNTPRNSCNPELKISNSRISGRHSSAGELEIIVENSGDGDRTRVGRVSLDSWNSNSKRKNKPSDFRYKSLDGWKLKNGPEKSLRKDGKLLVQGDDDDNNNNINNKHRVEHRIIISGGGNGAEEEGRRRWSDVEAADMLYLRSEMLMIGGNENGSGKNVISGRSVSEITGVSRYRSNNGGKEERERRQEEGVMKRWLDWISQSQQQSTAVNPSSSSSSSSAIV